MKVFVTRKIPEIGVEKMSRHVDVEVFPYNRNITNEELFRMAADCEGIVSMASNRIDETFFRSLPKARIVANFAVGYDNIDIEEARRRRVIVTNTPGVLTDATADVAITLILCVARRAVEGDRLLRKGAFQGVYPLYFLGASLQNKTLGIYGLGRIGKALAHRARAFGMRILYHNRVEPEKETGAKYVTFERLLADSDFLSINAPLTEQTWGRFGVKEFQAMRSTAFIINTARGQLVKEDELAEALKKGWIAGAGLDVYEHEPRVNPALLKMENVVLFPHIGSATVEVRSKMAELAADNIVAYAKGEEPPTRVR